jgi:hypothetical protein
MTTQTHYVTTLARFPSKAAHQYDVEVGVGRCEGYVVVDAANRNHAERIATKAGYVVRSVNMVG